MRRRNMDWNKSGYSSFSSKCILISVLWLAITYEIGRLEHIDNFAELDYNFSCKFDLAKVLFKNLSCQLVLLGNKTETKQTNRVV